MSALRNHWQVSRVHRHRLHLNTAAPTSTIEDKTIGINMLPTRDFGVRISSLRPLRPPSTIRKIPQPRRFTRNTQLLLLAQYGPRPQLPYLSQPCSKRPNGLYSQILIRVLSTETRRAVREHFIVSFKTFAYLVAFGALGWTAWFGFETEMAERSNPTPTEWRFLTAQSLRNARKAMAPATVEARGYVNWYEVGQEFKKALERLEDPAHEGRGLVEPADGEEILIPEIGRSGFDISAKSWPWRAGYFEVIMGCANAAEHLDGMALDVTRKIVFPPEVVIGPSNPDPRPTPPYMAAAPREENCDVPYAPPEVFYMRILTGTGFTTTQRIDAALAYASFLEYKKLPESADEMYKWSIDIARDGLPAGVSADAIIDSDTGVIKASPPAVDVSANLLRATTARAIHQARHGNLAAALPTLLSVLRARRSAPVVDDLALLPHTPAVASTPEPPPGFLSTIFRQHQPPAPPLSGNDRIVRSADAELTCEEGELMLYVGEILSATAPESAEGLGWTREAVRIADTNLRLQSGAARANAKPEEIRACKECLVTGVANWELVLNRLVEAEQAAAEREGAPSWWRGWLGWRSRARAILGEHEIKDQLDHIQRYKARIVQERTEQQIAFSRATVVGGPWIG